MRPAFPSALACALVLCLAGPAGAYRYDVREWSATWEGFADDFEDGVLPDGTGGTAPLYLPVCGVTGDSETGGALVLAGPDPLCPGQPGSVLTTTGGSNVGETRATFRFEIPALGQTVGLTVSDETSDDVVLLVLARNAVEPFFDDALLVALLADPFVGELPTAVAFAILSTTPPHTTVSAAALELRLATAPGAAGIVPTGSYRLCTSTPCEDEATTPFQALAAAPGAPVDGGALDPARGHAAALVAFAPDGAFSFEVEEWSTGGSGSDDFESAAFAATTPYFFTCGGPADVEQADGVLSLLGPVEPCGATILSFEAGFPGPLSIQASYDFAVPERCEAYGLSTGAGGGDFAFLSLVHGPDPLAPAGGDVLSVRLNTESEVGGQLIPVVASAQVSADPLADPALADVTSIELELSLAVDLAGLVPTGRFRLCTDTGCPPAFTLLEPGDPSAVPDAIVCNLPAASYDPPADGLGAVVWEGPVGATLVATRVPEPASAAGGAAAFAILLALRASRVTPRRKRCPTKT